jgi:hypothetical protein
MYINNAYNDLSVPRPKKSKTKKGGSSSEKKAKHFGPNRPLWAVGSTIFCLKSAALFQFGVISGPRMFPCIHFIGPNQETRVFQSKMFTRINFVPLKLVSKWCFIFEPTFCNGIFPPRFFPNWWEQTIKTKIFHTKPKTEFREKKEFLHFFWH